jgi:hypothetical protein
MKDKKAGTRMTDLCFELETLALVRIPQPAQLYLYAFEGLDSLYCKHRPVGFQIRDHWFCVNFDLGVANDGWTYKTGYNEFYRAIWVLHWQRCCAVYVEG